MIISRIPPTILLAAYMPSNDLTVRLEIAILTKQSLKFQ